MSSQQRKKIKKRNKCLTVDVAKFLIEQGSSSKVNVHQHLLRRLGLGIDIVEMLLLEKHVVEEEQQVVTLGMVAVQVVAQGMAAVQVVAQGMVVVQEQVVAQGTVVVQVEEQGQELELELVEEQEPELEMVEEQELVEELEQELDMVEELELVLLVIVGKVALMVHQLLLTNEPYPWIGIHHREQDLENNRRIRHRVRH